MSDIANSFRTIVQKRELILALAKRDITEKYAGQALGVLWTFFHPIFLMAVYITVFSYFFSMKTGQDAGDSFIVYMLSGLTCWLTFQELLIKSTLLISAHSSLVSQIAFPLEVIPIKASMGSAVSQIFTSALLFIYILVKFKGLPLFSLMWFPLFALQFLFMAGICCILSAIGIIIKDLKDVVALFCSVAIFAQPIFFKLELLPVFVQRIMKLNPFSWFVICYHDVFAYAKMSSIIPWAVVTFMSLFVFILGLKVFASTKHLFGDYL